MRKQTASQNDVRRRRAGAITLRGLDPSLMRRIDDLARRQGISRSRAALRLLQTGAGLRPDGRRREIGGALDRFIGSWSEVDARELRELTAPFGDVDPDLWK